MHWLVVNPVMVWLAFVLVVSLATFAGHLVDQERAQGQHQMSPDEFVAAVEVGAIGTVCTPSTGRQWFAGRMTASDAMPADGLLNNIMQLLCSIGVSCRYTAARPSSNFSTACTSRMLSQHRHCLRRLQPLGAK